MEYNSVISKLDEILDIKFETVKKDELEDIVNDLFVLYKEFINNSCNIYAKRQSKNALFAPPGVLEKKALEGKIKLEDIKSRIQEDILMSYAYGMYISNRLAHLFDKISHNPIDNSEIVFAKEFEEPKRKKEIKKRAFALKSMFVQKTIEQSRNSKKYNISWTQDEIGQTIMNINTTNYSLEKMMQYHNYPEDIIISVHVIDLDLADSIQTIYAKDDGVIKGNTPREIFEEQIYRELQEER